MKTLAELKEKLRKFACDEEAEILMDDELCCFINMANKKIQCKINELNPDNFTSCDTQTVLAGTTSIGLPSDIDGTRIKSVFWDDGKECCKLRRLPYDLCESKCKGKDVYGYQYFNKAGEGAMLYLWNKPVIDGEIRIIYTRSAEEIDDTSPSTTEINCDLWDYIFWDVMGLIYMKEKSPLLSLAIDRRNEAEKDLLDKKAKQFDDDTSCELEMDYCWGDYVDS